MVGREAMLAAGKAGPYSMPPAPEMPADISALLDSLPGLNRSHVLAKLRECMDATRTVTATFMGRITDSMEVADNPTQLKAIELALRMHRLLGEESQGIRAGTINIMWAGAMPPWQANVTEALPMPRVDRDGDSTNALPSCAVTENNSGLTVDTAVIPPPVSTVEGTETEGAPPPHMHSGKSGNLKTRCVKKRKPRLPVYRGKP